MRSLLRLFLIVLGLSIPAAVFSATAAEYYNAGLTLNQQGKSDLALQYFDAAIQTDPTHWQAYMAKGTCQYQMGNKEGALASFEKSLALHPDNASLEQFVATMKSSGVVAATSTQPATTAAAPAAKKAAPAAGKWKAFGLKVGAVMSTLKSDVDNTGVKSKIGIGGGLFYTLGLSPKLAVQPEVLYVQKGDKFETSVSYDSGTDTEVWTLSGKYKLAYVEVPLLFKYFLTPQKLHVMVGPEFSFCMGKKYNETSTRVITHSDNSTETVTVESEGDLEWVSSTDLGLVAGLGMNFGKMSLEFRYDMGLGNIYKGEGTGSLKNNAFMAFLGLAL